MTMISKLATASVFALAFATSALADPITFKSPDGIQWTVTDGGNGADISKLYMSADAATACPGHRIKLEASKLGPAMDKAQKFRGDKRWHIVCDRSAPPAATATTTPPPPAAQQQSGTDRTSTRNPDTIDVRYIRRL